jgi:hypothetical protein
VLVGTAVSTIAAFSLRTHVSAILLNGISVGISLVVGYAVSWVLNQIRPRAPAAS